MSTKTKKARIQRPVAAISIIFVVCFILLLVETLFIRTDKTFWGSAFIHPLLCIGVLVFFLAVFNYSWEDIGFRKDNILPGLLLGFGLAAVTFTLGYVLDFLINTATYKIIKLEWFVTTFTEKGVEMRQTGFLSFFFCILFGAITVVMQEGLFRGLFTKLAENKYSFLLSNLIVSGFFGLWHIAAPLRQLIDGDIKFIAFLGSAIGSILLWAILGFKFGLLYKISGGLWAPIAEHFAGSAITSTLHVVADGNQDQYIVARIATAQILSLIIVLVLYYRKTIKKLLKIR